MTGMLKLYNEESYSPSDFTYTITNYNTDYYYGRYYYDSSAAGYKVAVENKVKGEYYQITPQKAGISTFHIKVNIWTSIISPPYVIGGDYYDTYDIQYTINSVDVTNVSIPEEVSLNAGDTYIFQPVVTDRNAQTTLTWRSEDASIASVDASGKVTAVKPGTTTITCTAHNGVSAKCKVSVKYAPATGVSLNAATKQMYAGSTFQLKATVAPANGASQEVQWSSDNPEVASVDEGGMVTAVGTGTCQITATTKDGSDLSASCQVSVIGDYLYTEDSKAVIGSRFTLPIYMNNAAALTGVQFDLYLPEGITVVQDEYGDDMIELGSRTNYKRHEVATSKAADGALRVIISSKNNDLFTGNSGTLLTLQLLPGATMQAGRHSVMIRNVVLTDPTAQRYTAPDTESTVTVSEYIAGDVNNDGYIDVSDLAAVVRFILENADASLIFKAADMDGNGTIEITDYSALVNVILNQNASMPHEGITVKARKSAARRENLVSLTTDENGNLCISLRESRHFAYMQFDLTLPEGVMLDEDALESTSRRHSCWTARREDGSYRILCTSMTGDELSAGTVLRLKTCGTATGTAAIHNVVLSDTAAQRHEAAAAQTALGETTGVKMVQGSESPNAVYDMQGRRIFSIQGVGVPAGIYIVNGKKVMIK